MLNGLEEIHIKELAVKTKWDDGSKAISSTISVTANLSPQELDSLMSLQGNPGNLYMTIASDQPRLVLTAAEKKIAPPQ
jgi:hypothetical protein